MDPQGIVEQLRHLLNLEAHGLVRHLENNATPYLSPATVRLWKLVPQTARISHDHEHRLVSLISAMQKPLQTSTFQTNVAHYHYLDLPALLPKLIREKRQQLDAYDRAITHAVGCEPLQGQLESLRDQIKDLLRQLEDARQECFKSN